MSLLSRLFGKSPSEEPVKPAPEPVAPSVAPPRPDPAIRAREEEASLTAAIESGDRTAVGRWVLEGSTTALRQRAAGAIADPDQVAELIRATRGGKDKSVYRILTATRDAQLAEVRRAEQLQADLARIAADVEAHMGRAYDASYAATLIGLESRWHALESLAPPELKDTVDRGLARAHEVIESHRAAVAAEAERRAREEQAAAEARRSRELAAEAAAAEAAEAARVAQAERAAEDARHKAEADEVRHLIGLLRQAEGALEHGGTARASRLRAAIDERLPAAPVLPAWYAGRLEHLDARIAEMKDWKTFTVVPKRTELLHQMQALVDAELSPQERVERIRRIRNDWRTLHRGAGEDPSPEWQEFEEAAERAFEPCREFFAQQAELRHANQARREAVLERLAGLVAARQAGEPVDLNGLRYALGEARREWREAAPVDPSVHKALQARFHELAGGLQAEVSAVYSRHAEARRAIIARAAALADVPDLREAIDEAKRLQQEWKASGPVPRAQDAALWQEFRGHCDAVFKRNAERAATMAASLDASHARAHALCEQVEHIAGLGGEALLAESRPVQELRAEFDALDLPRSAARELRQRFSRAVRAIEEALRRERDAAARRAWSDVFAAAVRVHEYATAVVAGDEARIQTLSAAARDALGGLAPAPRDARAALERQLGRIEAGTIERDPAANERALRLLCVRAELASGLESPAADQELRRDHQMRRLVESLGQGVRAAQVDLDELALEWLGVGPVADGAYEPLLARFQRARGD